jgi:hypothetical protein
MDGTEIGNSWNIEHLRSFILSKISKAIGAALYSVIGKYIINKKISFSWGTRTVYYQSTRLLGIG